MDIDMGTFLAAVVEQEGGSYTLKFEAFEKVATMEGKALAIDPSDDGASLTITIVDVPEDAEVVA